jgi:ketosteroid isomerase-like protein
LKADPKTQAEVTQAFKGMFEAYKKQDLQATLQFWAPDPDVFVLGSGADEKGIGITQLTEHLKRDWAQCKVESIGIKNYMVSAAGYVAWLSADISFHGNAPGDAGEIDFAGRLTGVLENRNGRWLWVQMHLSVPSVEQAEGQSWPEPH